MLGQNNSNNFNNTMSYDNDYRYQQQKTTLSSNNNQLQQQNQYIPTTVRDVDSLAEDSIMQNNNANYYNDDDSVNTATNLKLQQQFQQQNNNKQSDNRNNNEYARKYNSKNTPQQMSGDHNNIINIQIEESFDQQQQQLMQIMTPQQQYQLNSNGNNYDFLIDEEYQQVKALQGELTNAKWLIMGEKLSLTMILKDVVADLMHQDDILSQSKSSLPHNRNQSNTTVVNNNMNNVIGTTANSSQKTGAGTSFNNTGQYQNYIKNTVNYKNPKYMNMKDLDIQLKQLMQGNNSKIDKIIDKQRRLKVQLQQEQEKSQYLESQLNSRLMRQSASDNTENQRESYITELETQLQETRKFLLDKNLKLTDKDQEITALKRQLQQTDQNFRQLEQQKHEIDELVIKVSQELKTKESDLRDFNYQLVNDRDHLARQVDLLKKELHEEKERRETLEVLEHDLIYKCEQKENEVSVQKEYIMELQDKVSVNSEAIEKAQKIIQRLNEELEKSGQVMRQIENERDQHRAECKDQGKRILDLNKQLQNTQAQHQMTQQHVSIQLKQEIDELKEALRQYQQQFDDEKRSLNLNLREANDEKYKLHIEKEKIEITLGREVAVLKQQLDEIIKTNKQKLLSIENDHKEQIEGIQLQNKNREDQAQSQIKYLQKRLREIQSEYVSNQGQNVNTNNKNNSHDNNINQTTGKQSYLQVLRQEFDVLSQELLQTRQLIKTTSTDLNNVNLPTKLQQFDDFKLKVINALQDWESKAEGLAQLSKRYEKELDDQKKLFLQMKQMLRDKDILIVQIQKQVKIRDQQRELYVNTMRKELERQTYLIKSDLIEQFQSTQQTAQQVNYENQEQERRFQSFKYEYIQVLEDRDKSQHSNLILKGQLEVLSRDLDRITTQHFEFADRIRVIVNKSQGIREDTIIMQDVESLVDELRIRNEECISYKEQVQQLKSQQEEDKQFMQNKVQAVEQQLHQIQKSNLQKEEDQQQSYLQKETKLINDIQRLQSENSNIGQQLQTRERQVKKLQDQKNQQSDEIQELLQKLDQTSQEKFSMEQECQKTLQLIQQIQSSLDETQSQLEQKHEQILSLETDIKHQSDRNEKCKEQLYSKELELQREMELNLQLQDEKYQAVNNRDTAIEKQNVLERENQKIYEELVMQKETVREVSQAFEEVEREKIDLQRTCEQMNEVVAQVQDEILESQRAIEGLNHALEKMRRKYNRAKELKHQIKNLKHNEHQQNELIEAMRRQLNKPKQTQECQTDNFGMQQIAYLSEESQLLQQRLLIISRENDQLQESMQRQNLDINRLIEEKRDLEDLVDQQNQAIKQIRLNNQQQALLSPSQNLKENYNILNTSAQKYNTTSAQNDDLFSKILQEKENYIMRLEQELSDMRHELEILKEKLISYEIGNLSLDRSLAGGVQHIKSYNNPTHTKNSIAGIANQTTVGNIIKSQQGYIKGYGNIGANNLSLTNNSLHFSNMYNATQATNNPLSLNAINNNNNNNILYGSITNNLNNNNNHHQYSTLQAVQNHEGDYKSAHNRSSLL